MKKGLLFLCAAVMLSAIAAYPVSAKDDWEWWDEIGISRKLNDSTKLTFTSETRSRDDMGELYLYNYTVGTKLTCRKWLDLGFYLKNEEEKVSGSYRHEDRPEIDVIFKWAQQRFSLSDRSKFEYRMIAKKDPYLNYRNKLEVSFPGKVCSFGFNCVVSEEFFYDFSAEDFNQNRMIAGLNKKITGRLVLDLGYMYRTKKSSGKWTGANVLVTKFGFAF